MLIINKKNYYFKHCGVCSILIVLLICLILLSSCNNESKRFNDQLKSILLSHNWVPYSNNVNFVMLKFTSDGKSFDLMNPSIISKYELVDSNLIVYSSDKKNIIQIKELNDSSLVIKFEGQEEFIKFKPAKQNEIIYGKWRVTSTLSSFLIELLPEGMGSIEMISDTTNSIENLQFQIISDTIILIDKNNQKRKLKYVLKDEYNLELIDANNVKLQLQRI